MITETGLSFFQVDNETFDLYLAIRDELSHIIEINDSLIRVFFVDFEEIRKKLLVDKMHQDNGWRSEHIRELPRVLRQLKNLGLIKRLFGKDFLSARKLLAKNGRFPKKLFKIKWAESDRFFDFDGKPQLSTSILPLERLLYEKLKSET